jgi:uroporphyrinogen-III synthase
MDREMKAEIKRRYKQEVHPKGIYCVRCTKTGQVWVDSSNNLLSSENRLNFSLKTGMNFNKELRTALESCGADVFEFDVLEIFDQDLSTYELNKLLKERRIHWQAILSGLSLYR